MKTMTKRILALVLAVVLIAFSFAACSTAQKENKVYKVGVIQLVQHPALDKATEGFQTKLTELLGEGNVEFDVQNASGEATNCSTIANNFVTEGKDLIMANATPALQAAASATTTIPILGTSITDYGVALDIEMEHTGATGINVSGTSDLASLTDQAAQINTLFPKAKTVNILYCSAEANSSVQAEGISAALKELGVETKTFTFSDSNDLQAVAKKAVVDCDVLYVPTDNTVASNGGIVATAAEEAKIPVMAAEESTLQNTKGVATYSINYQSLGEQTAEMAYEILVKGADVYTMNIQSPKSLTKEYIKVNAEKYGALDVITADKEYVEISESAE